MFLPSDPRLRDAERTMRSWACHDLRMAYRRGYVWKAPPAYAPSGVLGTIAVVVASVLIALICLGIAIPSGQSLVQPGELIPMSEALSMQGVDGGAARTTISGVTVRERPARLIERLLPIHRAAQITEPDTSPGVADPDVAALFRTQFENRAAMIAAAIPPGTGRSGTGTEVIYLTTGKTAGRIGIRTGDVIVRLDDTPIDTEADLFAHTRSALAEQRPTMEVWIEGRPDPLVAPMDQAAEDLAHGSVLGMHVLTRDSNGASLALRVRGSFTGGSAGLAAALAAYQVIHDRNDWPKVAATGEMFPDGAVGTVGFTDLKALAVRDAGLRYFLVPEEDAALARSRVGSSVAVIPVATVEEAVAWLDAHDSDS